MRCDSDIVYTEGTIVLSSGDLSVHRSEGKLSGAPSRQHSAAPEDYRSRIHRLLRLLRIFP